jgi:transcriptional regulator with XRE-family HTH domain
MLNKEDGKTFGDYVKHLRAINGYKQLDLAVKLDNNPQNVSSLERNKFAPSLAFLYRLADAFNINIVQLIQGYEDFKMSK